MLTYILQRIPDLTLSKYQVFADSGIEGMLEAQTQFIRQLYRVALIGKVSIHFVFDYEPSRDEGKKLRISLIFSGNDDDSDYYNKLRKIVNSSGVSKYFAFMECPDISSSVYSCMSVMRKKERILQTVIDNDEHYFYVVPNWEMKENARLYGMLKMMQSFNVPCCYRADLYVKENIEEEIHKSFEKPLTFLRNISNNDKGISEYSRLQKYKRDPNVDETLKQYEDWLKAVDSSSVFLCKLRAMSNDQQYCKFLLDSAMSESLASGNGVISDYRGEYSVLGGLDLNSDADGLGSDNAPKSMKNWPVEFTVDEIAAFTRFPVLYDGESIEIPKETSAVLGSEGLLLGKDKNEHNVFIPIDNIAKHMFVCGVPGSGKTNTMLHLANSLNKAEIPFLVLEPAKKEYRELAQFDIPKLMIFSPSACTDFPLRLNPFEFPRGLTLSEHINNLCQVFEGAFPISPPAPFILDRAIQAVYENHNWSVKDVNTGVKSYPTMTELYERFEKELEYTNYDSEIRGNIRSVLEMRIGSLLRREKKEIFDVDKSSLSPEEWLKRPVIIELEALGEGPANFVTLLLCTLIRETLKVNPMTDKDKKLRHVIFIEEAHNLIAPESQVSDGMDSNPKIAATAFIVKMLAEVRALREGIIIADQLPTAMAPEVIKNTNIKLVHRLTSADDRELVGSTMSASPMQLENMAVFTQGEALFTYEKLLRPFEMGVCEVEEHGNPPDDKRLYELMLGRTDYFNMLKANEEEKWRKLQLKIRELVDKENMAIKQLRDMNFINIRYADLERRVESCVNILSNFKLLKSRYEYECQAISEKFISTERKKVLSDIINNIGVSYGRCVEQIIKYY